MPQDPSDWHQQLQESLRRAQESMRRAQESMPHGQEKLVTDWTQNLRAAYPDWGRQRWQRKLERRLQKQAERDATLAGKTLGEGYLWLFAGILTFLIGLDGLFPLMIVAVFLARRGIQIVSNHSNASKASAFANAALPAEEARTPAPRTATPSWSAGGSPNESQTQLRARRFGSMKMPTPQGAAPLPPVARPRAEVAGSRSTAPGAASTDPRDARVDGICDRILAQLKTASPAVREVFHHPEETVQSLRKTCRDLTRRERELRGYLAPEEDLRLSRERAALQARVEAEPDEVTRMRLASALAALDQQRDQRLELARSATRFEAEHTRIAYTLENLSTQIVRMGSSDAASSDVAGAGLRRSLDLLSQDMTALADALDEVHASSQPAVAKSNLAAHAEGPGAAQAADAGPRGNREKA